MHFKRLVLFLTVVFLFLTAMFFKLAIFKQEKLSTKPLVVCTTTIIADAINQIASNTVELVTLMGPGVDPHLYKPIEQDVIKISQADIIFYNGLHLEARMGDLFEKMATHQITIAVCKDMPKDLLIKSQEHGEFIDPHVWFDPMLWTYSVKTITNVLQKKYPENYDLYENNKNKYLEKVYEVYQATYNQMQQIMQEKRILITGHDAFSYFARAYHCKVISLQGISTASEAGTQDVQSLINFIYHHKIPTIFVETSIPSRNIQALQQGASYLGYQVQIGDELYSDALGSANSEQGTYIGMLEYNVKAIVKGLIYK